MNSTGTANNTTEGWVPQNEGRGTLDILLKNIITILLCCWTSVCVNVPAINESSWQQLWDKLKLAILALVGPDFVLIIAIGQWESARKSVKAFRESDLSDWTMRHAFFADMGGFLIKPVDSGSSLPVNAEQLLHLIQQGHVTYPVCTKGFIDDKNKRDGLARIITIFQAGGFAIITIGRLASSLPITSLELTTLAFLFVTLVFSCFWRHKPQDVVTPVIVPGNLAKHQLHHLFGPLNKSSFYDPWICCAMWRQDKKTLKAVCRWLAYPFLHWRRKSNEDETTPSRIPSDNFPTFSLKADGYCGLIMIIYSCIFLCGWNFPAPTKAEQILWRVASTAMLAFTLPCGFVLLYIEYRYYEDWKRRDGGGAAGRFVEWWVKLMRLPLNPNGRALTVEDGKPLRRDTLSGIERLPTWASIFCVSISIIYCTARAYILIEDFAGLRKMPNDIYKTTQWSEYFPQM